MIKERNSNEYDVFLWLKFFQKYKSLNEPMVEAFPELHAVSEAMNFPATCYLADTVECEMYEGAPPRYNWTPEEKILLKQCKKDLVATSYHGEANKLFMSMFFYRPIQYMKERVLKI